VLRAARGGRDGVGMGWRGAGLMVMVVEVYSQTVEDARNDDGIRPAGVRCHTKAVLDCQTMHEMAPHGRTAAHCAAHCRAV